VVLSPETLGSDALVVAQRIRSAAEGLALPLDSGEPVRVTLSAGVATYPISACDEASLLRAADQALYAAKRAGKNRVVSADAIQAATPLSA